MNSTKAKVNWCSTWQGRDSDCIPAKSIPASRYHRKTGPRQFRSSFRCRPLSRFAYRHRKWPCTVTSRKITKSTPVLDRVLSLVQCTRTAARNYDSALWKSTEAMARYIIENKKKAARIDKLINLIGVTLKLYIHRQRCPLE